MLHYAQAGPTVILVAARITLAALGGVFGMLGLRRHGQNFLTRLVDGVVHFTARPLQTLHIVRDAQKGAAEDAIAENDIASGYFQNMSALTDYTAQTIAGIAWSLFTTVYLLTHVTIPQLLHGHTAAISARASKALAHADRAARDRAIGDAEINTRLKQRAGALAAGLSDVFGRVRTLERDFAGAHIGRLWHRVGALEKLLAGAALGALVLTGLRRSSCEWSCSRTGRRFGRFLHRVPRELLNLLLDGTLVALGAREFCFIVKELARSARLAAPVFEHIATLTGDVIHCTSSTRPGKHAFLYTEGAPSASSYLTPPTG